MKFYVRDKGHGSNKRPSIVCTSFDPDWDAMSTTGELNMEMYASTEEIDAVTSDNEKLMTTVVFAGMPLPAVDANSPLSLSHALWHIIHASTMEAEPADTPAQQHTYHGMCLQTRVTAPRASASTPFAMTSRSAQGAGSATSPPAMVSLPRLPRPTTSCMACGTLASRRSRNTRRGSSLAKHFWVIAIAGKVPLGAKAVIAAAFLSHTNSAVSSGNGLARQACEREVMLA